VPCSARDPPPPAHIRPPSNRLRSPLCLPLTEPSAISSFPSCRGMYLPSWTTSSTSLFLTCKVVWSSSRVRTMLFLGSVSDRRPLSSGGASGIGKATALRMAKHGYYRCTLDPDRILNRKCSDSASIVLGDMNAELAEATKNEITAAGGYVSDVHAATGVREAHTTMLARHWQLNATSRLGTNSSRSSKQL
jgi:hypothetical protein